MSNGINSPVSQDAGRIKYDCSLNIIQTQFIQLIYLLHDLTFAIFRASIFSTLKSYCLQRLRRKKFLWAKAGGRESKHACCDNGNQNERTLKQMKELRKFFRVSLYNLYLFITDSTTILFFYYSVQTVKDFIFV